MDITYLLWLQDFRVSINEALTPFMTQVSTFAVGYLLLVPMFIYLAVNKRNGLFLMSSYAISTTLNSLTKLTFCVYRPWVRDPRIVPAGNAIKTAGGYSFPSGHTMEATPVYAGLAVLYRKKSAIVLWVCVLGILLTMLSRNYLGVHTPQDVIVGTLLGLLSVYLASRITGYILAHPERENMMLIAGLVVAAASCLYITLKPYPMDYTPEGKLIVNPIPMINSSVRPFGILAALVIGRWLDKKFIHYQVGRFSIVKAVLTLICLVPVGYMDHGIREWLAFIGPEAARFMEGFLIIFYVVVLLPIVFKLLFKAGND